MGLVEPFVKIILERTDNDSLRFEAAWTLTNIASGTSVQTGAVVSAGGIEAFGKLLDSQNPSLVEQALWGLGNIAGDIQEYRAMIVQSDVFNKITNQVSLVAVKENSLVTLRYGIWCLSNISRGCVGFNWNHATPIIHILSKALNVKDIDVLADGCWCSYYLLDTFLVGGDNLIIQEYINMGIARQLLELLSHVNYPIQGPALRAVGTIMTGTDDQTQLMIYLNCIPKLSELLNSPRKNIRREACWALSNIAAGTATQIQELLTAGVFFKLFEILENSDFETKREAAWCVSNACNGATVEQIASLVQLGVINALARLLDVHDTRVVQITLEAMTKILSTGAHIQRQEQLAENPFVILFEEANTFDTFEQMQYMDDRPTIQKLATEIMTNFLDTENGNEIDDIIDNSNFNFSAM